MIEYIDDIYVCDDCLMWLVNRDATGLDYYLSESEALEKLQDIQHGERYIQETMGYIYCGDDVKGFSTISCDCCGEALAGRRHQMKIFSKG